MMPQIEITETGDVEILRMRKVKPIKEDFLLVEFECKIKGAPPFIKKESNMLVVGFMGADGELGRTFAVNTDGEMQQALNNLFSEQGHNPPPIEYWQDSCTYEVEGNIYFVGGLETI